MMHWVGVTSYAYDNNGNTKSKTKGTEITLYSWNDQGRLVAVQNPNSDVISYQYNESGIRVSSTINGVKTSYLLDANRDYAQVLEEYTSSGIQAAYVYGHDLISQNRNGSKSFYLYDGLGSTKALTDSGGAVTDRYIYDAYGNVLSSIGTTQNSYLYAGEQFDKNLGQYYLRDRYYSQSVGRFARSDSYQGDYNNPLSLNKYLYTHGNPINAIDPSGQFSIQEVGATIVISGILSALSYVFPSQVNIAQETKVELHYFYQSNGLGGRLFFGPVHTRVVLINGSKGLAFDGDPYPPYDGKNQSALVSKDPNGIPFTVNDSFYKNHDVTDTLNTVLPFLYMKETIIKTMNWVNSQRFRYVIDLFHSVNSNSVASQAISDLGFYRNEIDLRAAPGWQTDLRNESSTLEKIL